MAQSLSQIWLHVVFSTKHRRAYLQNETFRNQMFRMIAHHVKQVGCISASVGGFIDHVHLLVGLPRTVTVASLLQHVKTETSKWAKASNHGSPTFLWQTGYGVFSVSHSKRNQVDQYIRGQAKHHATITFQEEFRMLCQKHEIDFDEEYVWN